MRAIPSADCRPEFSRVCARGGGRIVRIGINWTSWAGTGVIQQLISSGRVNFCELLIDNFLHLPPKCIRETIGDTPISFHIMWSRYLERSDRELITLATLIKAWITELQPLYVSDHIARFSHGPRHLPLTMEVDYDEYAAICLRVVRWQNMLDTKIHFENFPSTMPSSGNQVAFFRNLIRETGCGLLFDISNAVVASSNQATDSVQWLPLLPSVCHFHIAGYRMSDTSPQIAIDTHDSELAQSALDLAKMVVDNNAGKRTIVVERDANIDVQRWLEDIIAVHLLAG